MKKIGLGKKLVSIVSAGVLASAFMAPAAFAANTNDTSDATTGNIPTAEGHGTANSASPTADTSIYLIDTGTTNKTFSVTAPLKIYLAYDGAEKMAGSTTLKSDETNGDKDYTLLTPSADVVTLQNVGANQPYVDSWAVSNTTTAISEKAYDAAKSADSEDAKLKDDQFYLTAIADSQPGAEYDIGVSSTETNVSTPYPSDAKDKWKLPKSDAAQSYIALDLKGHIYNPTSDRYQESSKIQVVTWTFALPSES